MHAVTQTVCRCRRCLFRIAIVSEEETDCTHKEEQTVQIGNRLHRQRGNGLHKEETDCTDNNLTVSRLEDSDRIHVRHQNFTM